MSYPKLTPIIAKGATEPRYLEDRFADIINVKDFGAKGDGVTDDTAIFQNAVATGKAVFVPEGSYKLIANLTGNFCSTGNSVFIGGTVNGSTILRGTAQRNSDIVNVKDFGAKGDEETDDTAAFLYAMEAAGDMPVYVPEGQYVVSDEISICRLFGSGTLLYETGHPVSLKKVGNSDSLSLCYHGETAHDGSNSAPQSIGCADALGNKVLFLTQVGTTNESYSWHINNSVRINWYALPEETKDVSGINLSSSPDVSRTGVVEFYGLGHGGGCEPCVLNEKLYLYSTVSDGTGFSKIEWKGSSTSYSDIKYVRGLPYVEQAQVGASADGKKLIFVSNQAKSFCNVRIRYYTCAVFDREEVESNLVSDGTKTATDGVNTYTMSNNFTCSVKPETVFAIPYETSEGGISGVTSDGEYIYILFNNPKNAHTVKATILVYSMHGNFVKRLISGLMPSMMGANFSGETLAASAQRPKVVEFEGISVWKNRLFICCKINSGVPSAFISYKDKVYYPSDANAAGVYPEDGAWEETKVPASIEPEDFDPTQAYTAPTSTVAHHYLVSIAVTSGDEHETSLQASDTSKEIVKTLGTDGSVVASNNGNIVSVGTFFENTHSFSSYVDFTKDGKVLFHDSSKNIKESSFAVNEAGSLVYTRLMGLYLRSRNSGSTSALHLYHRENTSYPGAFALIAHDGTNSSALYGYPNGTLKWNGDNIQTDSDARLKTEVSNINADVLDAWGDVEWRQFKWVEAVENKGKEARYHTGVVAQSVLEAFERHNIDACKYGFLCHDESINEEGVEREQWMVRYAEAFAFEAAYLRSRISKMQEQIDTLVERVNQLTNNSK